MNYTDLVTRVGEYFHRSDLATKIPGFIQNAEAMIFREINPLSLEGVATGTTTTSIALPADCNKVIRLEVEYSGSKYTIDYTSPNGIEQFTSASGVPERYTIQSGEIRLIPEPASAYTYTLYYTVKLTPLSDSNLTNWVTDNAADLMFYATCLETARWCKDDAEAARCEAALASQVESVRAYAIRNKYPSSGGIQIKPRGAI